MGYDSALREDYIQGFIFSRFVEGEVMGGGKESPGWFTIFSFLCMAGTFAALVIILLLAPYLSDAAAAWLGPPVGLVLIWIGRGVATGKWSR